MADPIRVIHCGTGTAGMLALRAILDDADMALAGLLVHSDEKAGRDAGELAGRQESGVRATGVAAELRSVAADCVCYMLLTPDIEHIVGFLESGKNVVTTAGLMHPLLAGAELAERIDTACRRGNSSFHVTGINPGWVDATLPLAMSQMCSAIDTVTIQEYANCGEYPAPHIISVMGFGKTPAQIDAEGADHLAMMRSFFRQSIAALAQDLGCAVDEVTETRDFVLAESSYGIKAGHIAAGTIAGQRWRWCGLIDGRERVVQETYWFTAFDLGPGYPRRGELGDDTFWRVTIEGQPSLRCTFEPRVSFADAGIGNGIDVGTRSGVDGTVNDPGQGENPSALATAMAAVSALRALPGAATGLVTPADLTLRSVPGRLRRDRVGAQ